MTLKTTKKIKNLNHFKSQQTPPKKNYLKTDATSSTHDFSRTAPIERFYRTSKFHPSKTRRAGDKETRKILSNLIGQLRKASTAM
jgi:hypothetical protein